MLIRPLFRIVAFASILATLEFFLHQKLLWKFFAPFVSLMLFIALISIFASKAYLVAKIVCCRIVVRNVILYHANNNGHIILQVNWS